MLISDKFNKRNLLLILYIFLSPFVQLSAQPDETEKQLFARTDSSERIKYITNARKKFTLYAFCSRFSNGILYNGNRNLLYYPISPVNIGLGFTHKWLGANLSVVAAEINKGRFEGNYNYNFQLNAYSRSLGFDLVYSVNHGYYGANYKSFLDLNLEGVGKELPRYNLRMEKITVNAVLIFNGSHYSLNAPLVQGEVQKSTSSSFLLNAAISSAFASNSDSLFVPQALLPLFEGNTLLKRGSFYTFSLLPGYGFTWVFHKKFFIGVVPSFGPSFQYHEVDLADSEENYITVSYKVLGRFGAGFHSEHWTCGLSLLADAENFPLRNNTSLLNNVGKVYFRIGYKFNVPKWAKKYSDLMDKYQDKLEKAVPLYLPGILKKRKKTL